MKLKLDENIPAVLGPQLQELGHDTDSVAGEGLTGHDDESVWSAAQSSGRFLITQDLDFSDVRTRVPGEHHGILLVRLRDPGRLAMTERVLSLFAQEDVESWKECLVVATERKVRIRRS